MSLDNLCQDIKVGQCVEFVLGKNQKYVGYRVAGDGFYVSSLYPAVNPILVNLAKGTLLGHKIKSYSTLPKTIKLVETRANKDEDWPISDHPFVFSDSMSRELEEDRQKANDREERRKRNEDEHGILGDEDS